MPLPQEELEQLLSIARAGVLGYLNRVKAELRCIVDEDKVIISDHIFSSLVQVAEQANNRGEFDRFPAKIRSRKVQDTLSAIALEHAENIAERSDWPHSFVTSMQQSMTQATQAHTSKPATIRAQRVNATRATKER